MKMAKMLRSSLLLVVFPNLPCATPKVHAQILNGDFSAGNTNFSTDYRFDPNAAIIPSYYTIASDSQSANPNYPKFGDHTTGTGKMLLADGHTNANEIIWSQTVPATPNTSYAFSAWAAASGSGSPAVLRFLVNSNQLGPDFPLSGNPGVWQRFITVWNSGTNTGATLSILDTNLVYVGNDFALDDVAFYALTNQVPAVTIYPAVELGWTSQTGALYQVQYSTTLNTNEWINVGLPVRAQGTQHLSFR